MGVAGITRGGVNVGEGQVEQLIGAHKGSLRESLKVRALGTLSSLAMKDVDVTEQTIQNNKVRPTPVSSSRAFVGGRKKLTRLSRSFISSSQLIGNYLLSILTGPSPSPDSMVAALNGIFDIYADETAPWDVEVFRKGSFLEGLKSSVSKVRAIVSGPSFFTPLLSGIHLLISCSSDHSCRPVESTRGRTLSFELERTRRTRTWLRSSSTGGVSLRF